MIPSADGFNDLSTQENSVSDLIKQSYANSFYYLYNFSLCGVLGW